MADGRWSQMGEVVAKAWSDPDYKARLLQDATAVLKEAGIEYGPGVEVKVVENTDSVRYITLPQPPSETELSDEQLDRVAGGRISKPRPDNHIPDS